ncbi:MAG: DNA/RNA helicase [Desulfovibrio sp.]|nr:DNA/RNA helicase [Desulfovibrio sp.]
MGLSFAARNAAGIPEIEVEISAGIYRPENRNGNPGQKRKAIRHTVSGIRLCPGSQTVPLEIGDLEDGVYLHVRNVPCNDLILVSVMLVNGMEVQENSLRQEVEQVTLFQTRLRIRPAGDTELVARPERRAAISPGDRSANLLYRKSQSFAVGHTCSAIWKERPDDPGRAESIETSWLPEARVPDMDAGGHPVFRGILRDASGAPLLRASAFANAENLLEPLLQIPAAYREWLEQAQEEVSGEYAQIAKEHRDRCEEVCASLEAGARSIALNPVCARAFRLANAAMLKQFQWKNPGAEMIWRPFQLGFILLAAPSTLRPGEPDQGWIASRRIMDLLWFPTGGGKTEAYLGLIALLLFQRRLRNPDNPDAGAGVAAIMRYTLRLLTTQQFMRASALIFACESLRRQNESLLGKTPFSIGLWVGENATPNKIREARQALAGNAAYPTPAQLVNCPACGSELEWEEKPKSIEARCANASCELAGFDPLPVWTVDEFVYRRRPSLLIGTVDKFAQIVRKEEVKGLFGLETGSPPDLIIQDELHLLTGPLGSIAGLYETMVDGLFASDGIPPKIIGSTATIRNAAAQIRSLYDREARQFPPSYLDAGDSGFAVEDAASVGRTYCGVTAAGRSMKTALEKVSASLLQSVGALAAKAPAAAALDSWWTLVGYFNSLRELGGALVLMQDETRKSAQILARLRGEPERQILEVNELTSRLSQTEVRDMLGLMATPMTAPGALDVVLASNMLSVGVDVARLGMMVVNGQPKSMSEYIQATSRVGRGATPGLVVTLHSHSRARDRSHYESFFTFHRSLYRDVEPASVTPFAPRARDRALHAVLAGLLRHLDPSLLEKPAIRKANPELLEKVRAFILERAARIDAQDALSGQELDRLLHEWRQRAPEYYWLQAGNSSALMHSAEDAAARAAAGRKPGQGWPTLNSMRAVEPGVAFRLKLRKKGAAS